MIAALAVLSALLGAAPPDACTRAHDVTAGQVAPCSGVLVPVPVTSECVRLRVSVVPRLELRVFELLEVREIETASAAERLSACDEECARLRVALASVTVPPVRPWHEAPGFVAATSIIGGVVLGVLGTWLVVEATQ